MVFKEIKKLWRKEDLLNQAYKEAKKMYKEDERMVKTAIEAVLESRKPSEDIHKMDKKINRFEVDIRKRIFEHLTINPRQDTTATLILLGISTDIERIADYAKNIFELSEMHPQKLSGKYVEQINIIVAYVYQMFDRAYRSVLESDEAKGKKVVDLHHKTVKKECDALIKKVMQDKEIKVKDAVTIALLSRYLKRVSAHLMNIASSSVYPFHKLRTRGSSNGKK